MYNINIMSEKKSEERIENNSLDEYLKELEEDNHPQISKEVIEDLNDYSYIKQDEDVQRKELLKKVVIAAVAGLLAFGGVSFIRNMSSNNEPVQEEVVEVTQEEVEEEVIEEIEEVEEDPEADISFEEVINSSGLPINLSGLSLPVEFKNFSLNAIVGGNIAADSGISEVGSEEVILPIVKDDKNIGSIKLVSRSGEVVPIEEAIVTEVQLDFNSILDEIDEANDMPDFMISFVLDQFFEMDEFGFEKEGTTLGSDYVLNMNNKDEEYKYVRIVFHKEMGSYKKFSVIASKDR